MKKTYKYVAISSRAHSRTTGDSAAPDALNARGDPPLRGLPPSGAAADASRGDVSLARSDDGGQLNSRRRSVRSIVAVKLEAKGAASRPVALATPPTVLLPAIGRAPVATRATVLR